MNLKTMLGMTCLNFGVVAVVATTTFAIVRIFSLPVTMRECYECGVYVVLFIVYPWSFAMVDGKRKVK